MGNQVNEISGENPGALSAPVDVVAFNKLKEDLLDLREDFKREKANNLIIFGIFASLIGFLSIEVKLFSSTSDPVVILGVSLFFLGALGLFLLLIIFISSFNPNCSGDKKVNTSPIYFSIFWITIGCIVGGVVLVVFASLSKNAGNHREIGRHDPTFYAK